MTADQIVMLFERCARRYLDHVFAANTCIEQTRVLVEVLKRFGIVAEPLGTKLHAVVPQCKFQHFSSGDPEDYARAKANPAGFEHRRSDHPIDQLAYHVVALVERQIFVDLTLAQISAPQYGFVIEPFLCALRFDVPLAPEDLPEIRLEAVSDAGIPFTVRWVGVRDRDWENAPAWEPSHLWGLIARIEADMRKEMG